MIHRANLMISPPERQNLRDLLYSRQKRVSPPVKYAPSTSCVPPVMTAVSVRLVDRDVDHLDHPDQPDQLDPPVNPDHLVHLNHLYHIHHMDYLDPVDHPDQLDHPDHLDHPDLKMDHLY